MKGTSHTHLYIVVAILLILAVLYIAFILKPTTPDPVIPRFTLTAEQAAAQERIIETESSPKMTLTASQIAAQKKIEVEMKKK